MKIEHKSLNLLGPFLVLVCGPMSWSVSSAQSTPPTIGIERLGTNVGLNYQLASTNGYFVIQGSTNVSTLGLGPAVTFVGDASTGVVGRVVLPISGAAEFFSMRQDTNTPYADLTPVIDDGEDQTGVFAGIIGDAPAPLTLSTPLGVSFRAVDAYGATVSIDGVIELYLVNSAGAQVSFSYTITPPSLTLTNGGADGTLVIQGDPQVAQSYIGFRFFPASEAVGIMPAGAPPPYQSTLIPCIGDFGWSHPLGASGSATRVSGTFGEYPGHKNVHRGIDLAAPEGTAVLAARSGKVLLIGPTSVSIAHGNGDVSAYHHVDSITVQVGQCVEGGQKIAEVGNYPGVPVHLHFQISMFQVPLRNSVFTNAADVIPSLVSGDSTVPELFAIHFRKANPATQVNVNHYSPSEQSVGDNAYVLAYLRDLDMRAGRTSKLVPRLTTFETPDGSDFTNDFKDSLTVDGFKQNPSIPGYAKLTTLQPVPPEHLYQLWYPWDTTVFKENRTGPRGFALTVRDANQNQIVSNFLFGPKLVNKVNIQNVSTSVIPAITMTHYGPLPNFQVRRLTTDTVVDNLVFTLDTTDFNGWKASFDNQQARLTKEVRLLQDGAVRDLLITNLITLTNNGTQGLPGKLRLRSYLGSVTNIADEVEITVNGRPTNIVIKLGQVNGWATPVEIRVIPTGQPSATFTGSNNKLERGTPFFSTAAAGATFYSCNTVSGFPQRLDAQAPFPNRTGASSFIAVKKNEDGTQEVWVNASMGAFRTTGTLTFDWEYQIRYYSGNPGRGISPSMTIGTVPNAGFYGGQEVTSFDIKVMYGL